MSKLRSPASAPVHYTHIFNTLRTTHFKKEHLARKITAPKLINVPEWFKDWNVEKCQVYVYILYLHNCQFIINQSSPQSRILPKLITVHIVKKFPTFYRTQKTCYHVYNSLLLVPVPSQMNPVHTLPPYFLSLSSGPFPSGFLILCALLNTSICAKCLFQLILLHFTILIFGANYEAPQYAIFSCLLSLVLSLSLWSKYSSQHPVLEHLQFMLFP
jgi:hypothetical protein